MVLLAEMTMADLANDGEIDTADFLSRVLDLRRLGFHVLISEFFRYFRVRQYLARYSREPVGIVTDLDGFGEIVRDDYYEGLDGGILEGLGKLFPARTTAYVYPRIRPQTGRKTGRRKPVRLADLPVADHLRPVVSYLHERGQLVVIDDFEPPSVT